MTDFLESMAVGSRARAAATSSDDFKSSDFDKPVIPVSLRGFDVIAEIKDRSPAEGELRRKGDDRELRAREYAKGGAVAISVLTEPSRFEGELCHLEEVVAAVPTTAVMRKDFLVDAVQVLEARRAGASGVLLIAAMLTDSMLRQMCDCAWEHGMFVLLESFDEDDLQRSGRFIEDSAVRDRAEDNQLLIGVNTRNLRTLEVDSGRLQTLAPALPKSCCVAESGIRNANDAAHAAAMGYQAALVGTALMKSKNPAALIATMREIAT